MKYVHLTALLFTTLMSVAKICGFTSWPWLWILLPLPITLGLEIILAVSILGIMFLVAWIFNGRVVIRNNKKKNRRF
jgi:hypothetical protein